MRTRATAALVAALGSTLPACAADGPAAPPPAPVSTFARPDTTPPPTAPPTSATADTTSTAPPADDPAVLDDPEPAPATTAPTTSSTTTTTLPPAPPPPNSDFERLELATELVADVYKPTGIAFRSGDPAMYIATQPGPVLRLLDGVLTTVIDFTGQTFEDTTGSERGVLGIAFDPRDGRMFINLTDVADDTNVISFELGADGRAILDSRREVLFVEQPGVGHNGGRLAFDAKGNLFISNGDGGASNGWDAQDTTKLFGAILRVRPNLDGDGYTIPDDNPFADGSAGAGLDRPEVIARGFRNPWTFSIDDDTGDIWIGDVGNSTREEVSLLPRSRWGANFGWPWYEGAERRRSGAPDGVIPPVFDWGRDIGVAAMGGYVYRGTEIPELEGAYLFGDLSGPVWAIGADGATRLDIPPVRTFVGWGEDPDGELYLLGFGGVFKMVRAPD